MLKISDKYSEYFIQGGEEDDDEIAALWLLKQRLNEGYWYDDWDDGNDDHQWESRAKGIAACDDGTAALKFVLSRDDHEYEGCEREEPDVRIVHTAT